MKKHSTLLLLLLLVMPNLSHAIGISYATACYELDGAYLVAQDPSNSYLGFFGNDFASESINNRFGTYGNEFSSSSIRNQFGSYGTYGLYGTGAYSSYPPMIYKNNSLIGFLSDSQVKANHISLGWLDANCNFYATSAYKNSVQISFPYDLTSLVASQGSSSDSIALAWSSSLYATAYEVSQCSSVDCNEYQKLGDTTATSTTIINLQPNTTYTFAVRPYNSLGYGGGLYTSGYTSAEENIDSNAPLITLNGNENLVLFVGERYDEQGASAIDDIDGAVEVLITGDVDTSTVGTYEITYTARDSSGNTSRKIRTITVKNSSVNINEENVTVYDAVTQWTEDYEASFYITVPQIDINNIEKVILFFSTDIRDTELYTTPSLRTMYTFGDTKKVELLWENADIIVGEKILVTNLTMVGDSVRKNLGSSVVFEFYSSLGSLYKSDESTIISFKNVDDPDNDKIISTEDNCPTIANGDQKDLDNDGIGDICDADKDGDGVDNIADDFPLDKNESIDTDGDGVGNNTDQDDDGDGYNDEQDAFPLDAKRFEKIVDTDGDGTPDSEDNCPNNSNLGQQDFDNDGKGDLCDPDDDNDGYSDLEDVFPYDSSEFLDTDNDGLGNNSDTDDDNDGVLDVLDAFPLDPTRVDPAKDKDGDGVTDEVDNCEDQPNSDQSNLDNDAFGDACDLDIDGDGFGNSEEQEFGTNPLDINEYPNLKSLPIYILEFINREHGNSLK